MSTKCQHLGMILLDICPPGTRHSTVGRRTEVSPPMPAAQVAVADYRPDWWPTDTRMLIRRVRLDVVARLRALPTPT